MRTLIGFVSLVAVLALSACGGEDPKTTSRAKGNATIAFDGCPYNDATIPAGSGPTPTDYGTAIPNGSGNEVTCAVSAQGTSVAARIESAGITLDVSSSDLSNGAQMIFFVPGTGGTPAAVSSVNANNDLAPTCSITTSRPDTLLTAGNGTIFAEYSCGKVLDAANVGVVCQTRGLFYFTGCGG